MSDSLKGRIDEDSFLEDENFPDYKLSLKIKKGQGVYIVKVKKILVSCETISICCDSIKTFETICQAIKENFKISLCFFGKEIEEITGSSISIVDITENKNDSLTVKLHIYGGIKISWGYYNG